MNHITKSMVYICEQYKLDITYYITNKLYYKNIKYTKYKIHP